MPLGFTGQAPAVTLARLAAIFLLAGPGSAWSIPLSQCLGWGSAGTLACSLVPQPEPSWSYSIPGPLRATGNQSSESAALSAWVALAQAQLGPQDCGITVGTPGPEDAEWGKDYGKTSFDFSKYRSAWRKPVTYTMCTKSYDSATRSYGSPYTYTTSQLWVYGNRAAVCADEWVQDWDAAAGTAYCRQQAPVEDKSCRAGNPVAPDTGAKLHSETDYADSGPDALVLTRLYRSHWPLAGSGGSDGIPKTVGRQWTHRYDLRVELTRFDSTHAVLRVLRPDHSVVAFTLDPASAAGAPRWIARTSPDTIAQTGTLEAPSGFVYRVFDDDSHESYDGAGRLRSIRQRNGWTTMLGYSDASTAVASYLSGSTVPRPGLLTTVTNAFGRELRLVYDGAGRLSQLLPPGAVKDGPAGNASSPIRYAYAEPASLGSGVPAADQLTSVTWQDGALRRYHYEDSRYRAALTGITDETGVRIATYKYNWDRKVSEEYKAGGAERLIFSYGSESTEIYDYSTGSSTWRKYTFQNVAGTVRPTGVTAPCALCGNTLKTTVYDAAGNVAKTMGHDGTVTFFQYDARGRETERAVFPSSYQSATTRPALSAATRVTSTDWHATWQLPIRTAEPGEVSTYAYDANGNVTQHSWWQTADATGAGGFGALRTGSVHSTEWSGHGGSNLPAATVEKIDSVETGRWITGYHGNGDIASIADVKRGTTATMPSYDPHGRMLAGTADTGAVVGLTYSARGLLKSKSIDGQAVTFDYTSAGTLRKVTMPDGQALDYVLDANQRLIDIKLNGVSITPQMLARGRAGTIPTPRARLGWSWRSAG